MVDVLSPPKARSIARKRMFSLTEFSQRRLAREMRLRMRPEPLQIFLTGDDFPFSPAVLALKNHYVLRTVV